MQINWRFLSWNYVLAILIIEGRLYKVYSKSEENTSDFPVFHNEGSANKLFKGVFSKCWSADCKQKGCQTSLF